MQKVRRETVGRTRGFSIRVCKGVYYRTGGFRGRPVENGLVVQKDGANDKPILFRNVGTNAYVASCNMARLLSVHSVYCHNIHLFRLFRLYLKQMFRKTRDVCFLGTYKSVL